jgi:hypothetical protein
MDASDRFLLELDFTKEMDETIKWWVKKEQQTCPCFYQV